MSETSNITKLKMIITPGNAELLCEGSASVSDLRSILDTFKVVTNVTNLMNLPEIKENENDSPITENKLDDNNNAASYEYYVDLENEGGNIVENNNEQNLSIMRYPVRGQAMSLNGIQHHGETVMNSWITFSSIMFESSIPRVMYGHNLTHYRIVFPAASLIYPEITVNNGTLPEIFKGHSYPVCSCPSYIFKNVDGPCKHIDNALASANIKASTINWTNRPDNMPNLLKSEGLNEYQWVPAPAQN